VPTWGEILQEIQASAAQNNGRADFDGIRRKYLAQLNALTDRDTIIYYTDWFSTSGEIVSITLEDMQGMMEVVKGLQGPGLDIILHSPGGSPEAARSIVRYLRRQFTGDVRVFVPLAAMSAATMWALASDEIVMGKHSQLGPIDPQLLLQGGAVPARAIIEQFEQARDEIKKDPSALAAWLPILQQYAPALLKQCETAEELSRRLVREWLSEYMLAGDPDAKRKAAAIARYFASYKKHQSHGMGIDRDQARAVGVNVADLEADPKLQDAVLSVHHAAMHTLSSTGAVKIVENHLGKAFVKSQQTMQVQVPMIAPVPGGPGAPGASPPVPAPTAPGP
jgi:ATP-dependent protease ClpP protease subunit